jgi:hypothetical protein
MLSCASFSLKQNVWKVTETHLYPHFCCSCSIIDFAYLLSDGKTLTSSATYGGVHRVPQLNAGVEVLALPLAGRPWQDLWWSSLSSDPSNARRSIPSEPDELSA